MILTYQKLCYRDGSAQEVRQKMIQHRSMQSQSALCLIPWLGKKKLFACPQSTDPDSLNLGKRFFSVQKNTDPNFSNSQKKNFSCSFFCIMKHEKMLVFKIFRCFVMIKDANKPIFQYLLGLINLGH